MVQTVITFRRADVQPPVYVAGGFTDWAPIEMASEPVESTAVQHRFSHTADLQPGKHQYKFRLGPGDWWVCDESTPTEDDGSGNVNNVLTVEPETTSIPLPQPAEDAQHIQAATVSEQTEATVDEADKKEDEPVHVHEEKESVPPTLVTHEAAIPDFAPPPYSAEESGAHTPGAFPREPADPFAGAGMNKTPCVAKPNGSGQSWVSQNLVLVVAIVVVPVAVTLIFRR